jgi:hypothetical protein
MGHSFDLSDICDLIVRLLDMTKITTLTPSSLLILCKLSFLIVGLKIFSVFSSAAEKCKN